MRLPAAARLALWEAGNGAGPAERDLALLAAGSPGVDRGTLRGLGIGRRDARLLAVYEAVAGGRLHGTVDCGACGETLEVTVEVCDLLGGPAARPDGGPAARLDGGPAGEFAPSRWTPLDVDGYQLVIRLPDSDDLAAAAAAGHRARDVLAARVLRATRDGRPLPVASLPAAVLDAALRAMAESDPLAEPMIATTCPWCAAPCTTLLDVGAFLWAHVRADACRLMSDVDTLARAYGWTEAEILALSDVRRTAYLELAR